MRFEIFNLESRINMPYRYLEDIAIADAAFEAWGATVEEMIVAASDATVNIMVDNLEAIRIRDYRSFKVRDAEIDMLLFQVLQELIYFKDAERLLLRVQTLEVKQSQGIWTAMIQAGGESIDPQRHHLIVDVKAVTLHRFRVQKITGGWNATVVVDV